MLLAEAHAPPRIQYVVVVRRNEGRVPSASLLDPAPSGESVQVAHVLRLLHRVSAGLDPRVVAPDRLLAPRADEVPDEPAVAEARCARCAVGAPDALELLARRGGVLVALRQQPLGLPVEGVTGREQRRCVVEMLVRERDDFEAGHAT
jgi:hypothetical protein